MLLALDALREGREDRIEALIHKLLDWQRPRGDWGYPHGHSDLSCTQYATLGLWVAHKRGIAIDASHWLDALDALDDYREDPRWIDNPDRDGGTAARKVEVAGYKYRDDANQRVSGSMTSAGLSVLAICRAGLGKKLGRGGRNEIEQRIDAAMRWLAQNFDVTKNPNGGHYFYYLYGLERIGALLQTERIGEHWWYIEGARELLQRQRDGHWGDPTDTAFALLFLRRATSDQAPTTGLDAGERHTFAAGDADADVRIRGAGQQPLNLWVDGFGEGLLELHREFGLRVVSVAWRDDRGNVLGRVDGDPTGVWRDATFLHREKALPRGEHKVRATVTLLANDAEPGRTEKVEVVESPWMSVAIRDVFEPWMAAANASIQQNLLRTERVEVASTSDLDNRNDANNLIDGRDATRWLASPDDANPGFTISWSKPVRVGSVFFTLPAQHERQLPEFDAFEGVEVRFNNDRNRWTRIPVSDDPLQPVRFDLPKDRRIREVEVRFYGRTRTTGRIGLAEFALLAPADGR